MSSHARATYRITLLCPAGNSTITVIQASNNMITSIPPSLFALRGLQKMDASENRIMGPLPAVAPGKSVSEIKPQLSRQEHLIYVAVGLADPQK